VTHPTLTRPPRLFGGPLPAGPRRALAAIEGAVALNALGGMGYALGGAAGVPDEWLRRGARGAALASSAAMVRWIVAQVATIGYRSPLQPLVAATGLTVAYLGARA
jgi:hypothetical protein